MVPSVWASGHPAEAKHQCSGGLGAWLLLGCCLVRLAPCVDRFECIEWVLTMLWHQRCSLFAGPCCAVVIQCRPRACRLLFCTSSLLRAELRHGCALSSATAARSEANKGQAFKQHIVQ